MESNQHDHEYSKSSSEETDRSELANDVMGIGRSYECVFCKRGFTTAQALGGHMNIHRKDRAKPARPNSVPSISSRAIDEDYASFRGYPPIQSYPPHQYPAAVAHHHHDQEVHINYQTFFPASSTWGVRSPHHVQHIDDYYVQKPEYLDPFSEEHQLWRRNNNLSLQIGPSHPNHGSKSKREDGGSIEEDELDLELRLGHDR